jgi:hypothetical protein
MNTQRFALVLSVIAIVLTAINLVVLLSVLSRPAAVSNGVADVLRAHEFQVVDAHGRVRAQIAVLPPSTGPDGKSYAETVLLRLIDPNGRPGVKIGTSVDGSAMSLEGDSEHTDWSGVQLLADSTASVVKLTNKDGSVQVIQP